MSGPDSSQGRSSKQVLQPITRTPSPLLLPTHRQPVLPYGGVIGMGHCQSKRQAAQKGILCSVGSQGSNQQGSSTNPLLLSPKRPRSPSPLEYTNDNELMKEAKPDWSEWVTNPHLNYLGRWLTKVDLGKPLSDEEEAQGWFGIGWSIKEERAKVNAYEDEEASEVNGLLRTHECKPPRQ